MSYPEHLLKLIESLKKLPGVGSKSAERFAFEMMKWPRPETDRLATLIHEMPDKLSTCIKCGCLQDKGTCSFCNMPCLSPRQLCILASSKDPFAINATGEFKGRYHVLGHLISPLDGIGPETLQLDTLTARIQELNIQEIVIALDSTIEGDATALYLKKHLAPLNIPITRIAFGIPMGSSFDYVDGGTLARAFSGRFSF